MHFFQNIVLGSGLIIGLSLFLALFTPKEGEELDIQAKWAQAIVTMIMAYFAGQGLTTAIFS